MHARAMILVLVCMGGIALAAGVTQVLPALRELLGTAEVTGGSATGRTGSASNIVQGSSNREEPSNVDILDDATVKVPLSASALRQPNLSTSDSSSFGPIPDIHLEVRTIEETGATYMDLEVGVFAPAPYHVGAMPLSSPGSPFVMVMDSARSISIGLVADHLRRETFNGLSLMTDIPLGEQFHLGVHFRAAWYIPTVENQGWTVVTPQVAGMYKVVSGEDAQLFVGAALGLGLVFAADDSPGGRANRDIGRTDAGITFSGLWSFRYYFWKDLAVRVHFEHRLGGARFFGNYGYAFGLNYRL